MPVQKCENGKFRIGGGPCMYETKEKAESAQAAFYANAMRTVPMKIQLAENTPIEEIPERVQLMRTCTFWHKQYGKVDITRQMFSEMITNFESKVRGVDLMIDYAHDSDREAAGWIKSLNIIDNPETNESELWANVDWTPKGRKTLSDKEFAYLSADFDPNYQDNENPTQRFGSVLLGAGLTNRPVIKRMKPAIILSEFSENNIEEKKIMDNQTETKPVDEKKPEISASEVKLAQIDDIMNELGVSSIEELMNMIRDMKSQNVQLAEEKESQEKETKLNVLLSEGKISQAQKETALTLEKTVFDGFIKLAEMNSPVVKMDEQGSSETPTEEIEIDDAETKVMELAEKKANDEKISFAKAVSLVLSENKELAKKYYQHGDE